MASAIVSTPEPEICGSGLSAIASEKSNSTVTTSPGDTVLVSPQLIKAVGRVLSTVTLSPELGIEVITFPSRSVPVASSKTWVPSPEPTVQL